MIRIYIRHPHFCYRIDKIYVDQYGADGLLNRITCISHYINMLVRIEVFPQNTVNSLSPRNKSSRLSGEMLFFIEVFFTLSFEFYSQSECLQDSCLHKDS